MTINNKIFVDSVATGLPIVQPPWKYDKLNGEEIETYRMFQQLKHVILWADSKKTSSY